MAHFTASITVFEHNGETTASVRVFRVFEFGAAPKRPVWSTYVTLRGSREYSPQRWLPAVLEELLEPLDAR